MFKRLPRNEFEGDLDGEKVIVEVVGTYGHHRLPICRVTGGKHDGKAMVVDWHKGQTIKEIYYKE